MENYTFNSYMLQIEGLNVEDASMYPVFFLLLSVYLFIMIANVGIVALIILDKSLHQPMYLLFCNLPFNDILGNSVMLPRVLMDILQPPAESALVLVGILLGLTIRLSRCRALITNPFCDNASLVKLSCESVVINNIYGLPFTVVILTASIGSIIVTYTRITVVCLTSKSKSLNSKALKTCSTHLFVYMIMFVFGKMNIALHRFPEYSEYRKVCLILFHIVPGSLNPIIYGVQSKEMKRFLSKLFYSRKVLSS
ncbi:olfactory receptor 52N5-like [Poecilia formosa]|uniref:olfactory receptor 52N5-like n=1 Tax=Poecilia formosa TaxID=48698 RepID=UPI0007BA2113|nr:PREDICTED: olfactory receptor 52N5-like [Poecilia formosa]